MLTPLQGVATALRGLPSIPRHSAPADSLGVIVPERGNPAMLSACLASLRTALTRVAAPARVVVVVNGSPREAYAEVIARHPVVRHLLPRLAHHHDEPARGN